MGNKKQFKILLVTGIYPPDVGGPATYVRALEKEFIRKGHSVSILSFGESLSDENHIFISRKKAFFLRYIEVFLSVLKKNKEFDVVFAFDLVSVGLPCALAKLLKPKSKLFLRLGGDFLWERAYNNGRTKKPLLEYYKEEMDPKEKVIISLHKFVFSQCDKVFFSTNWQADLYKKFFNIPKEKFLVINNAFPDIKYTDGSTKVASKIVFYGRFIKLKNISFVLELAKNHKEYKYYIIGDGPEKDNIRNMIEVEGLGENVFIKESMIHSELLNFLSDAWLIILPSISEVSPNTVLEAIKLGKPILLTQECGFYEKYKESLLFFDPQDYSDMSSHINHLKKEENYTKYIEKIKNINTDRDWSSVSNDYLEVFNNVK